MSAVTHVLAPERRSPRAQGSLAAWITTVDHKRIGVLYMVTAMAFFLLGGLEAFLIRLQLARPESTLVPASMFNQLFTMHGLTMIFLAIMPLSIGIINFIVPLQIGARDVAFPRLNAISYWLFLAGGLILNSSWLLGGAPNAGWFNYAPLSSGGLLNPGPDPRGIDFYALGLQVAGIGTVLGGINFIVTILKMRAPGMSPLRLPLFCWTALVTSVLIVFAFPPLTANLGLLMFDRLFHTGFFDPTRGGLVLLWQQLFWIFGHPEVYILVLPAFGIISEIIPVFAGKAIFGYTSMVFAVVAIAFLAFMVWTHHMFTTGQGPLVNSVFAASSMVIAVPTGVKIFNWLATMAGGRLRLRAPLLYAVGFLITFVIGGMSGVMLAVPPADYQYNDSYFVVAHIHYVLVGGSLFAILAGVHYWFPKFTGRLLDERLARWGFWLVFVGFNVTFFPMHFLGLFGMPRRVATYPPNLGFDTLNLISTFGVFPLAAGVVTVLYNMRRAARGGRRAGPDPWDGRTLEWAIPSPPPVYNFRAIPLVRGRDALWVEKVYGDGRPLPAPDDAEGGAHASGGGAGLAPSPGALHLPAPTPLPALLALGVALLAYGAIFSSLILALAGGLGALVCVVALMYDVDPGQAVDPEAEAA